MNWKGAYVFSKTTKLEVEHSLKQTKISFGSRRVGLHLSCDSLEAPQEVWALYYYYLSSTVGECTLKAALVRQVVSPF